MFPSSHPFQSFCIVNIKFQILDYKMSIIKFRKQILGRYPLPRFHAPPFQVGYRLYHIPRHYTLGSTHFESSITYDSTPSRG